jgi:hypothetical protein
MCDASTDVCSTPIADIALRVWQFGAKRLEIQSGLSGPERASLSQAKQCVGE